MKKSVVLVFVCVIALLCPSFVLGQFGMGCCCPADVPATSCVTVGNLKVVPWLGFGYQWFDININFPFNGTSNSLFQNLDVSLYRNRYWMGSLGLDVALRQRLRFFAAAGTNLFNGDQQAYLATGGLTGGYNPAGGLFWNNTQVRWWELNLGGLYCLTDDVAILVGYKGDSLSQKPTAGPYATTLINESYSADFQAITRSPYIGIKICQCYVDLSLVWSPWLTSYDVKMPLSVIGTYRPDFYAFGGNWGLSGGGGNLLEAFAQGKLNISRWASMLPCACDGGVNLWLRGSWLQCRGNGNLDQSGGVIDQTTTSLSASGSGSGYSTFNRYLWALGISGQLLF